MNETKYLNQPRGPNTTWVLRFPTPSVLVGRVNPRTNRAYGKMIRESLGTRSLEEAREKRDDLLALIRIQAIAVDPEKQALLKAAEYAKTLSELRDKYPPPKEDRRFQLPMESPDWQENPIFIVEAEIEDEARDYEEAFGAKLGHQFYDIAMGRTTDGDYLTVADAYVRYLADTGSRLALRTKTNLATAIKDFLGFAGPDILMKDVDRRMVGVFVTEYLPSLRTPRTPNGKGPATIRKNVSQLAAIWKWAQKRGHLERTGQTPWDDQAPSKEDIRRVQAEARPFTPDEVQTLLSAHPIGTTLGDIERVALLTGVRLEEIVELEASQVLEDCQAYEVREGKTRNARRIVPLVGEAREVVLRRYEACGGRGSLFPELPVRPSTGKRGSSISQKFTRERRKLLGADTDGELKFHAFRHTWRTAARRAGIDLKTTEEMGGWASGKSSEDIYDHRLSLDSYLEEQEKVWQWLKGEGYIG